MSDYIERKINGVANSLDSNGTLNLYFSREKVPFPFGFEFSSEERMDLVGFNLTKDQAKELAMHILENL